jgi:hypothetical protein
MQHQRQSEGSGRSSSGRSRSRNRSTAKEQQKSAAGAAEAGSATAAGQQQQQQHQQEEQEEQEEQQEEDEQQEDQEEQHGEEEEEQELQEEYRKRSSRKTAGAGGAAGAAGASERSAAADTLGGGSRGHLVRSMRAKSRCSASTTRSCAPTPPPTHPQPRATPSTRRAHGAPRISTQHPVNANRPCAHGTRLSRCCTPHAPLKVLHTARASQGTRQALRACPVALLHPPPPFSTLPLPFTPAPSQEEERHARAPRLKRAV